MQGQLAPASLSTATQCCAIRAAEAGTEVMHGLAFTKATATANLTNLTKSNRTKHGPRDSAISQGNQPAGGQQVDRISLLLPWKVWQFRLTGINTYLGYIFAFFCPQSRSHTTLEGIQRVCNLDGIHITHYPHSSLGQGLNFITKERWGWVHDHGTFWLYYSVSSESYQPDIRQKQACRRH